jgi:glycosyltransferase involved in cell wall biosynthesis
MLANFQRIGYEQELAAVLPTLTVSRFLKEQMIRSGCPAENLHVLHSPAPDVAESFSEPRQADPPRFVFAGRIEPKKGVDWLLRSVAEVKNVHVDIAGTGDKDAMSRMDQLVSDLGVRERVTFHGWLDEDEVYTLIGQARALVFPSVWHEPAGLVTLEAAALGRPVIASKVGGIPEYASDEFSLRVEPRDISGLAACMDALANDRDRAEAMGRRGYQLAQSRFSMEQFLERLDRFYQKQCLSGVASTV